MCVLRPSGRWLVSAANPRTREDSSAVGPGEEEAFQTVTAPTGILLKNHPSPGQTRSLFAEVLTFFFPFFRSELLLATLLVIMMITPATQLPDSGRMRMGNGETGTGRVIRLSVVVATQLVRLHIFLCKYVSRCIKAQTSIQTIFRIMKLRV